MSEESLIEQRRRIFMESLISDGVYAIVSSKYGSVASNSDAASKTSRIIGLKLAYALKVPQGKKMSGQTCGAKFETAIASFVSKTFAELQHLRPGRWEVCDLGNNGRRSAVGFAQYEHLAHLDELTSKDTELMTVLGNDYMVSPDVVVTRMPVDDDEINVDGKLFVGENTSKKADLRMANGGKPILHASISAKWTIRSDRAQNSRTEALNLIRNRKGRLPHIMVVTAEPSPNRLASVALGTGDIDCVYHFALYELIDAVEAYFNETGSDEPLETLMALVNGKRLKDISDLPLDLCV